MIYTELADKVATTTFNVVRSALELKVKLVFEICLFRHMHKYAKARMLSKSVEMLQKFEHVKVHMIKKYKPPQSSSTQEC